MPPGGSRLAYSMVSGNMSRSPVAGDFSSDDLSSDEELQEEFSKGKLKPGLVVRKTILRTYTNNVLGMQEKLAKFKKNELGWLERMDVTSSVQPEEPEEDKIGEGEGGIDPDDDFKREMYFYRQAQSSVQVGLQKLEELKVPINRPDDYFAEMVKTDDHMRKVRQSLLSWQKILEQKEKARKLRELKRYGKKVQHEILQKRRKEKKAALEAVKKFKKGKGEKPSFLDRVGEDDGFPVTTESSKQSTQQSGGRKKPIEKSNKRKMKDKKFGFGGKKRWTKSNTAESSADMHSFNPAKHSRKTMKPGVGGGGARGRRKGKVGGVEGKKKIKTIRLGKSRRQKMKLKR